MVAASAAGFFADIFDGCFEDLAAFATNANDIVTNHIGQGGISEIFKYASHRGGGTEDIDGGTFQQGVRVEVGFQVGYLSGAMTIGTIQKLALHRFRRVHFLPAFRTFEIDHAEILSDCYVRMPKLRVGMPPVTRAMPVIVIAWAWLPTRQGLL